MSRSLALFLLSALAVQEEKLGDEHPEVAATLEALAELSLDEARFAQADERALRALRIHERVHGGNRRLPCDLS